MSNKDIAPKTQRSEPEETPFCGRFNPRSFPVSVRDRVEIDYASQLNQEEKRWLAAFNEAEYGGNPNSLEYITGEAVSDEERKRMSREIKRYQRDSLTVAPRFITEVGETILKDLIEPKVSNEDAIIEMIDSERSIERLVMESLMFFIKAKHWSEKNAKAHYQEA